MTATLAQRRYWKLLRYRRGGQRVVIDAAPAWAYIDTLTAEGWNLTRIAEASGITDDTLRLRLPRMHRDRIRAVLAVTREQMYANAPDNAQVPAVGAQRRIQALQTIGWTSRHITGSSCMAGQIMWRGSRDARAGDRAELRLTIQAGTWRRVRDAYDRLAMEPGPCQRSRKRGAALGWAPPLAWDDDEIDDPKAVASGMRRAA